MIDSHCHLHYCEENEAYSIVENAFKAGLTDLVQVATDAKSYAWGKAFAKEILPIPIHLTAGIYPTHASKPWEEEFQKIKNIVEKDHVCAIGEIGIDLYHDTSYLDSQEKMLISHMELAKDHQLPVILHCRKSWDSLSKIILDFKSTVKGVWHCFDGNYEQAMTMIDAGYMISLSGLITFNSTKDLQAIVKKLPVDSLLIETDSPYLSPAPLRGKKNQPSHVVHTLNHLAKLKEYDPNELEIILDKNTKTLFNF